MYLFHCVPLNFELVKNVSPNFEIIKSVPKQKKGENYTDLNNIQIQY